MKLCTWKEFNLPTCVCRPVCLLPSYDAYLRGTSPEDKAKENVDGLVQLIIAKLNQDQGIVDKKGQYLLLGSRGDWPELQPEGWTPPSEV